MDARGMPYRAQHGDAEFRRDAATTMPTEAFDVSGHRGILLSEIHQ